MCFCNHRYKKHNFDAVIDKQVKCKEKGCKCKLFNHVPCYGSNDVKCLCKHSYREHDVEKRKCKRNNCKCTGFNSKFTCNCGEGYDTHKTVIYTKEDRIRMGKPVDAGWFGESLMGGAGGMQNFGSMINDVYETEFKNMEKKPDGNKIMYKDGKPVKQGMNNINSDENKINTSQAPYENMSYEQAFGIKKK